MGPIRFRNSHELLVLVHTGADGGRSIGLWLRPLSKSDKTFCERKETGTYVNIWGVVHIEESRREQKIRVRRNRPDKLTRIQPEFSTIGKHGNEKIIPILFGLTWVTDSEQTCFNCIFLNFYSRCRIVTDVSVSSVHETDSLKRMLLSICAIGNPDLDTQGTLPKSLSLMPPLPQG
ncbi:hypothetical protein B0T25DRAFT_605926 [Lasiosphaeria hispida]|uniref:Uncharacterized protein n=1 Tax=Lasiosphaeria hispida TaxID=260671 RepID=A0AAJ0HGG2_9PEZI|nr:hypothetical protein B0T25DRAFT_605926 [Lasiosphaeria hispida]